MKGKVEVDIFIASENLSVMIPVDKFSVKLSKVTVVLSGTTRVAESSIIGGVLVMVFQIHLERNFYL